jgi:hypothetical protein
MLDITSLELAARRQLGVRVQESHNVLQLIAEAISRSSQQVCLSLFPVLESSLGRSFDALQWISLDGSPQPD